MITNYTMLTDVHSVKVPHHIPEMRIFYPGWLREHLGPAVLAYGALQGEVAMRAALTAEISPEWVAAARTPLPAPAPTPPHPHPRSSSVKFGTPLQQEHTNTARVQCHAAYMREALGLPPAVAPSAAALVTLQDAFPWLWRRVR